MLVFCSHFERFNYPYLIRALIGVRISQTTEKVKYGCFEIRESKRDDRSPLLKDEVDGVFMAAEADFDVR